LLNEGVFCSPCGGVDQKGIVGTGIFLNSLNDIMVRGTCNVCNGIVVHTLDFGEDKAFYEEANDFRKAIGV